ncbi:hypothetical protein CEXT_180961 [Caerostris extrusa]|uniref:Uncharacterized protein n=1 Tax=Caerostris extrusa TaxID=172846 RepID=A0AAV4XB28_CAEEX|nr:hypothetical protein CEXT_180961 [Caerostris extrusa]
MGHKFSVDGAKQLGAIHNGNVYWQPFPTEHASRVTILLYTVPDKGGLPRAKSRFPDIRNRKQKHLNAHPDDSNLPGQKATKTKVISDCHNRRKPFLHRFG